MLIVVIPILINKDVLEYRYNYLKFMVQNQNYICTNLIISSEKFGGDFASTKSELVAMKRESEAVVFVCLVSGSE